MPPEGAQAALNGFEPNLVGLDDLHEGGGGVHVNWRSREYLVRNVGQMPSDPHRPMRHCPLVPRQKPIGVYQHALFFWPSQDGAMLRLRRQGLF